ncbi:hypothetical protein ACF07Y_13515 [Streptomyces sp. NPDC016566]|uniref:hypothetical protein n=1 Tax=Streptomyces sp. NPDC016566 TaxID=3364967 RepID=UPI0037027DEE
MPGVTPRPAARVRRRRVFVSTFFGAQHVSGVLSRPSDLAQRYVELPTAVPEGPRD